MMANLDKKMLSGFSREVKSYLPSIKESIKSFQQDPTQHDVLKDALRYVHTIKGASALMGLISLSQVTAYIEDLLEAIVSGQVLLGVEHHEWIEYTIAQIDPYLDCLTNGQGENEEIIQKIEKSFGEIGMNCAVSDISKNEDVLEVGTEENQIYSISDLVENNKILINSIDNINNTGNLDIEANDNVKDAKEDLKSEEYIRYSNIETILERGQRENINLMFNLYKGDRLKISRITNQSKEPTTNKNIKENLTKECLNSNSYDKFVMPFTVPNIKLIPECCETSNAKSTDELIDLSIDSQKRDIFAEREKFDTNREIEDVDNISKYEEYLLSEDLNIPQSDSNHSSQSAMLNDNEAGLDSATFYDKQNRDIVDISITDARENSDSWDVLADEVAKASEALESIVGGIDEDVRNIYQVEHNQLSKSTIEKFVNHSERYLLFRIGKSHYAASVRNVLEICQVPPITPLPNTPEWLRGLINLRGEILSVIDLNIFFDVDILAKYEDRLLLIVRTEDGKIATSLIADQANGFVRLSTVCNMNTSVMLHDKIAPYLNGIFEFEGLILASLDLERFLTSSEVCQFQ